MEKKSQQNQPEMTTLGTLENGSDLRMLFGVFGFWCEGIGETDLLGLWIRAPYGRGAFYGAP
jgi:hypothetical protein